MNRWAMAILKITTDQDFLRKVSKPVTDFDMRLHTLLDDMAETMNHAGGIGIAGVQVGVLRRVCLVTDFDGVVELVNPEIVSQKRIKDGAEACLSVPGEEITISRPTRVKVKAQDRFGKAFEYEFRGLPAVCACHEIDHLDGVLIVDKKGDL